MDTAQTRFHPAALESSETLSTNKMVLTPTLQNSSPDLVPPVILGLSEAIDEAETGLKNVTSLMQLAEFTKNFMGWSIRKTASNFLFNSGQSSAPLMVIAECPNTDDDLSGEVMCGETGVLLDKMMGAIGRDRRTDTTDMSFYLTYSIPWRPPGNRSPTQAELNLAVPFLRKHIDLVRPKYLLLMGAVPAKILLNNTTSLHKLRGQWVTYTGGDQAIPTLITYAPDYLLTNPTRKRESWQDLQDLQQRMANPS